MLFVLKFKAVCSALILCRLNFSESFSVDEFLTILLAKTFAISFTSVILLPSFFSCLMDGRSYFDQRDRSSQAMWMDMALARQSGQELINHYVITNSPASAPIRRFFHASIKHLTATYQRIAAEQALQDIKPSIGDQMNHNFSAVDSIKEEIDPPINEASGYTPTTSDGDVFSPVVVTPRRSSTRLQSRESRLWVYHAGRQQWTCPWIPRLWIRHAGRTTSTTVHWQ